MHTSATQFLQEAASKCELQHAPHVLHAGRRSAHVHCGGAGVGCGVGAAGAGVGGVAGQAARVLHSLVAAHHPHSSPLGSARKPQYSLPSRPLGSDVLLPQPVFISKQVHSPVSPQL